MLSIDLVKFSSAAALARERRYLPPGFLIRFC